MCFALLIYNKVIDKTIKYFNFIITFTCFTTFSLFGIITLLMIYLYLENFNFNSHNKFSYFIFIVFSFFIILVGFSTAMNIQLDYNQHEIFNILAKFNLRFILGNERFTSFCINIKMFLQSPILGNSYYLANSTHHILDISSFSYMLNIYGVFGIFYVLLFFVSFYNSFKENNNLKMLILFSSLFILYNVEPHYMFLFSWYMLFFISIDYKIIY